MHARSVVQWGPNDCEKALIVEGEHGKQNYIAEGPPIVICCKAPVSIIRQSCNYVLRRIRSPEKANL